MQSQNTYNEKVNKINQQLSCVKEGVDILNDELKRHQITFIKWCYFSGELVLINTENSFVEWELTNRIKNNMSDEVIVSFLLNIQSKKIKND